MDRVSFMRRLAATASAFNWRCHAYCLLDTHFHALIETPDPNLGRGMQRFLGGHAYEFNRRHGRDGHVFVSPFYSRQVGRDEHLVAAAVYVVTNPVAAGLVTHPAEWPWCSYSETVSTQPTFVATELVHGLLEADAERARLRYCSNVDRAIAELRAERRGSG